MTQSDSPGSDLGPATCAVNWGSCVSLCTANVNCAGFVYSTFNSPGSINCCSLK